MPTAPTTPLAWSAAQRQTQPLGFVRRTMPGGTAAPDPSYALAGACMAFHQKSTGLRTDLGRAAALQEAARLFTAKQRRLL